MICLQCRQNLSRSFLNEGIIVSAFISTVKRFVNLISVFRKLVDISLLAADQIIIGLPCRAKPPFLNGLTILPQFNDMSSDS